MKSPCCVPIGAQAICKKLIVSDDECGRAAGDLKLVRRSGIGNMKLITDRTILTLTDGRLNGGLTGFTKAPFEDSSAFTMYDTSLIENARRSGTSSRYADQATIEYTSDSISRITYAASPLANERFGFALAQDFCCEPLENTRGSQQNFCCEPLNTRGTNNDYAPQNRQGMLQDMIAACRRVFSDQRCQEELAGSLAGADELSQVKVITRYDPNTDYSFGMYDPFHSSTAGLGNAEKWLPHIYNAVDRNMCCYMGSP